MMPIEKFNIRVYALCFVGDNNILISQEKLRDFSFTKFPGGGLELGEGLKDGLKRELLEEGNIKPYDIQHFYTTDFYQRSAFNENEQIISVYYSCKANINWLNKSTQEQKQGGVHTINLKQFKIDELKRELFTFPIDRKVFDILSDRNFRI